MLTVQLGQADSGGSRSVAVGADLSVVLPENPTTGYRWQLNADESFLQVVGDDFEVANRLRGAPGVRVLTFRALRRGQVRLALDRRRDWENVAVETFWLDLTITGQLATDRE